MFFRLQPCKLSQQRWYFDWKFEQSKLFSSLAHNIGNRLCRQSHNFCNLRLFYTRRTQGNYSFPFLWRSGTIAIYVSILHLARAVCNLLRSNFQSKYQCCSGSLQCCHQKKIRFFFKITVYTHRNYKSIELSRQSSSDKAGVCKRM